MKESIALPLSPSSQVAEFRTEVSWLKEGNGNVPVVGDGSA